MKGNVRETGEEGTCAKKKERLEHAKVASASGDFLRKS